MNPISMLTAADIMRPGTQGPSQALPVTGTTRPATPLVDILDALARQPGVIGVIDNGEIIGSISADEVITGLTRHRRREASS